MRWEGNPKCALVIGGTGLVGRELVKMLLTDDRFDRVVVFGRRSMEILHPKLFERIIDFNAPRDWIDQVRGDVLFSMLGTTLHKAGGSKAKQYEVDFTYQYQFALIAAENGVEDYVLVSSIGANPGSLFFYMRMKGELERAVAALPFKRILVFRPTQLYGERTEKRRTEAFGLKFTKALNKIGILRNRKPIHASLVAAAMLNAVHQEDRPPRETVSGNDIAERAKIQI